MSNRTELYRLEAENAKLQVKIDKLNADLVAMTADRDEWRDYRRAVK